MWEIYKLSKNFAYVKCFRYNFKALHHSPIATFVTLDLQTTVHTQCVKTLMIYPHTKFCVPSSTDSLVIAVRPKAIGSVCTAVTVLFHWYRTIILINMHISPRPINTYNFRALKYVALVRVLDHKLICLPYYNCSL